MEGKMAKLQRLKNTSGKKHSRSILIEIRTVERGIIESWETFEIF